MSEFCRTCPARKECNSICPELELHLKQYEVPQRELTVGFPRNPARIEYASGVYLTKREKEIVTLLGKGLTRQDVCQLLEITPHALRERLSKINKKR